MTMRLHTRLFVVLAVFGVAFLIVGSGAFNTVEADRTADVNVAGDGAALLELQDHNGPNGQYASAPSGGELEISFDDITADGVNQNATTTINDVFNVTNSGTQSTDVYITKSGANSGLVSFNVSGSPIDGGAGNAVTVGTGETIEVTIYINTKGQSLNSGDALLDSITIHAEA